MNKFKNLALRRPFLFGLVLIFLYALFGTLIYPVHFLFADNVAGALWGDALSKFIIFLVFFFLLWRFGWIKASGINRLGNASTWLIVLALLVYKVMVELYAFTGDVRVILPHSPEGFAQFLLSSQTSLIEETMVRALVLVAMISAWGITKKGQIKAIILSSLFFGLIHFSNLLIRPLGVVLFQVIVVTLPGIFYAAIVLARKTLWPAIVLHWLSNAAVSVKLIGNDAYQETFSMWVIFAVAMIPLMVLSAYLIWKPAESYRHETKTAFRRTF